jgi:hypothetical protein
LKKETFPELSISKYISTTATKYLINFLINFLINSLSATNPRSTKKTNPLVNVYSLLLNIAIEIVDFPIKKVDFSIVIHFGSMEMEAFL